MANSWHLQREKAGRTLLKITLFLVAFTPKILLTPIVFLVSFIYYLTCKNERENIKFYLHLLSQNGVKPKWAFWNFYHFAISICDKFRVWQGKIGKKEIILTNPNEIRNEFLNDKKGRVLLVSHFGNIDIARAISNEVANLDITILMYTKHSSEFFKILNEVSKVPVKMLEVGELDMATMLKIKEIIDSGGHIGIMGDRAVVNGDKNARVKLLGRECEIGAGAYFLAHLLKTKLSMFWAIKNGKNYELTFEHIADEVVLDRSKNTDKYAQIYADKLANMCKKYPHLWFNFFDFWGVK
ncbi:hypothetical protein [Campylobacter mucosalis]|uniref:hypothetical protein n=1 Tax=Campylobacter mucosalis TaxID=202 RepID=UPI0014704D6C|nr:hypothetical protein [Campylobacter mucosalis]